MVDTVPDFTPPLAIADAEGLECTSDGRIVLEGLPNTRDLGGIPASDGRVVASARLIRSGALDRVAQEVTQPHTIVGQVPVDTGELGQDVTAREAATRL